MLPYYMLIYYMLPHYMLSYYMLPQCRTLAAVVTCTEVSGLGA